MDREVENITPPTQSVGCVRPDNSNNSNDISASVLHVKASGMVYSCALLL